MRTSLAAVVVIAGCGGGKGPTAPGNTTPSSAPVPAGDPWAAVVKGATFTVDNKIEGEPEVQTIVATITDVTGGADRRVIHIAWTSDGKPLDASLPDEVTVTADTVTFAGYEFPRATKAELADGRYVMVEDDGTVSIDTPSTRSTPPAARARTVPAGVSNTMVIPSPPGINRPRSIAMVVTAKIPCPDRFG